MDQPFIVIINIVFIISGLLIGSLLVIGSYMRNIECSDEDFMQMRYIGIAFLVISSTALICWIGLL